MTVISQISDCVQTVIYALLGFTLNLSTHRFGNALFCFMIGFQTDCSVGLDPVSILRLTLRAMLL